VRKLQETQYLWLSSTEKESTEKRERQVNWIKTASWRIGDGTTTSATDRWRWVVRDMLRWKRRRRGLPVCSYASRCAEQDQLVPWTCVC
jgi:hypothetical protein